MSEGSAGSREEPEEWAECVDYVNGGPGFRLLDGSPLAPQLLHRQRQSGVQQQKQQHSAQQPNGCQPAAQQRSGLLPQQPQDQARLLRGIELLATYPEHDDAAAALLCHVGDSGGRAVLCSSHPELHPSWLAGQPPSATSGSTGTSCSSASSEQPAAAALQAPSRGFVDSVGNRAAAASALAAELTVDGHVQRLQAALEAGQGQRQHLWRSLLVAAGMGPWMQPAETGSSLTRSFDQTS